jgi:uridine kinase
LKPFLIGVAGLSGSGKTALARKLAPHLRAEVLTLDAYYHPQSHLSLEARARLNYDHPDALDWPLLASHLESLARAEPIEEPVYLFDQHTRAVHTRRIEPQPIFIVEGILALHHPEVRRLLDLSVFVTTRDEECLRRRLERDIAERGRTHESVLEQYHSTVWPMALQYVLPSREFASLVVSGEEPLDESVGAVLRILQTHEITLQPTPPSSVRFSPGNFSETRGSTA